LKQEFGIRGVQLGTGKQVAVGKPRGRGGAKAKEPEQLGVRLSYRYYEIFRRGKVNADKERVTHGEEQGEPEKKKPRGGRPKNQEDIDSHKLDPALTQGCD
jgi:hypothetical protein